MHKARENANGTFSIGKTWVLDDLSSIQSYGGMTSASIEEEQRKRWAGGVGFTATIVKPYYWQAGTPKEKEFFIASLIKIYKKYTGGKVPELLGFDAKEKEQLLGAPQPRGATPESGRREAGSTPLVRSPEPPNEGYQSSFDSRNGLSSNGVQITQRMFGQDSNNEQPLSDDSPDLTRGEAWGSPRSVDNVDPRGPRKISTDEGKAARPQPLDKAALFSEKSGRESPSTVNAAAASSPMPEAKEEEAHRPGLGPMIKQKSKRDLAGTFRKAATAYNAFKPRPGGAGDRQQEPEKVPGGPDGITGVVPAPSLLRGTSQDSSASGALDQPSKEKAYFSPPPESLPEVTVTATSPGGAQSYGSMQALQGLKGTREPSPERRRSASPSRPAPLRRKSRAAETARSVSALGVDPSLLQRKTVDIEAILDDFGCWAGELGRIKKPETFEAELRRELGRVEAGSWLGYLEQKDERVEDVERLLDRAIAECDELEGLLTLYSVELSVSVLSSRWMIRSLESHANVDHPLSLSRPSTKTSPLSRRRRRAYRSRRPIRSGCRRSCRPKSSSRPRSR